MCSALSLQLSNNLSFASKAQASITWLAVDHTDAAFVLAAGQNGSIQCFSLLVCARPAVVLQGTGVERAPLLHLSKSSQPVSGATPTTHTACVTGVDWYHVDTGLFMSSSRDGTAKLWDPNAATSVTTFDIAAPAHAVAAAPAAGRANLIAVASSAACVRLFDISSGSPTQTLAGHSGMVACVAWSVSNPYQLASGDASGQLLLWDIRRAGALHAFDLEHVQGQRRAPAGAAADAGAEAAVDTDGSPRAAHQGRGAPQGSGRASTDRKPEAPGGHGVLPDKPGHKQAHEGMVTGLAQTADGKFWLTAGTDNAARLWDAQAWHNTLVRYPEAFNSARGPRQLATEPSDQVLYHPSGSIVSGYHVPSGRRPLELRGHLATVNAAAWCRRRRALLTGGSDRSMLLWAPAPRGGDVCAAGDAASDASQDAWSADDEDEAAPLDALGIGPRMAYGTDDAEPFSGGRQLPRSGHMGAHGAVQAAPRAPLAEAAAPVAEPGRSGWRPDRRLAPAHAWRRGGARGARTASAAPSQRIQRIAARLIANLQQTHGASGNSQTGANEQ